MKKLDILVVTDERLTACIITLLNDVTLSVNVERVMLWNTFTKWIVIFSPVAIRFVVNWRKVATLKLARPFEKPLSEKNSVISLKIEAILPVIGVRERDRDTAICLLSCTAEIREVVIDCDRFTKKFTLTIDARFPVMVCAIVLVAEAVLSTMSDNFSSTAKFLSKEKIVVGEIFHAMVWVIDLMKDVKLFIEKLVDIA